MTETRILIAALLHAGYSLSEVGEFMSLSTGTVHKYASQLRSDGFLGPSHRRSGPPPAPGNIDIDAVPHHDARARFEAKLVQLVLVAIAEAIENETGWMYHLTFVLDHLGDEDYIRANHPVLADVIDGLMP